MLIFPMLIWTTLNSAEVVDVVLHVPCYNRQIVHATFREVGI